MIDSADQAFCKVLINHLYLRGRFDKPEMQLKEMLAEPLKSTENLNSFFGNSLCIDRIESEESPTATKITNTSLVQ